MRRLLVMASAMVAGCATAQSDPPVRGETPGHECQESGSNKFIGRPGTSEVGAEILRTTRAAVLRWAPPGAALTMDYRSDRVTVRLGRDSTIIGLSCG